MCGVRGTKGPKQRPSVDPELAPQEDSPSRKIGRRINQKRKKTGGSKSRKKKKATARKKGESRNKKGLVKRDTALSSTNSLRAGKLKNRPKKKGGDGKSKKKKRRKGKKKKGSSTRQDASSAPLGSDVRTRQVWPWMVGWKMMAVVVVEVVVTWCWIAFDDGIRCWMVGWKMMAALLVDI